MGGKGNKSGRSDMDALMKLVEEATGLEPTIQFKILVSVIFILIFVVLRLVLLKILWRQTDDVKARYKWKKVLTYILAVIVLLLLAQVWFEGFEDMGTYIGLLSAGIAIALKDLVTNVAAWMFIIIRRPFTVGDRIEMGSVKGDVIDIRIFQFTLLEIGNWVDADQSTGRIIHVPNGKIFTDYQANYTTGFQFIWNEIPILLTFESDWEKAKDILRRIAKKHTEHLTRAAEEKIKQAARQFMIFYSHLTPTVYTSVRDSGVLLTIRYICDARNRRGTEQLLWEDILREFAQHKDIDYAYPTQRFYDNLTEGKMAQKSEKE
jgi:small-conductance mechanosensitive channel